MIIIFAGVAIEAPAGAAMKMRKYKTPAILASRRGDVRAIRFVISAMLMFSFPRDGHWVATFGRAMTALLPRRWLARAIVQRSRR